MPKPPRELVKQIEVIEGVIDNLNDLISTKKIRVQYYGKDFLDELNDCRTKAMELRNELEVLKNNMEYAVTAQYTTSQRFAADPGDGKETVQRVLDRFLSRSQC